MTDRRYHTRVTKEIAQRVAAEGEEATQDAFLWCLATLTRGGFIDAAEYLQTKINEPNEEHS
jgi:hypothetical protein